MPRTGRAMKKYERQLKSRWEVPSCEKHDVNKHHILPSWMFRRLTRKFWFMRIRELGSPVALYVAEAARQATNVRPLMKRMPQNIVEGLSKNGILKLDLRWVFFGRGESLGGPKRESRRFHAFLSKNFRRLDLGRDVVSIFITRVFPEEQTAEVKNLLHIL